MEHNSFLQFQVNKNGFSFEKTALKCPSRLLVNKNSSWIESATEICCLKHAKKLTRTKNLCMKQS